MHPDQDLGIDARLLVQVLRAEAPALGRPETGVALKVVDMPASVHDGHALADAFSEVALLESFERSPSVCQVWGPHPVQLKAALGVPRPLRLVTGGCLATGEGPSDLAVRCQTELRA